MVPRQQKERLFMTEDLNRVLIDFSMKLWGACDDHDNVLVSPLSVALALGMVLSGAEGETKQELLGLLSPGIDAETFETALTEYVKALPSEEKCKFHFADSVWVNKEMNLKKRYQKRTEKLYNAEVERLFFDAEAVEKINAWVRKATDDMIDGIIGSIAPEAAMYLINALAFDAEWAEIYKDGDVDPCEFTAENGEIRNVNGMYSTERIYLENEACKGFIKPYQGNRFGFVALLPKEGTDLHSFVKGLTEDAFLDLIRTARPTLLDAMIPKFSNDWSKILNEPLGALGLVRAFGPEADFSEMSKDPVCIGEVIHKTHIEVDERGTKAGAVTAIMMKTMGMPVERENVILDRPFAYMIADLTTGVPMFAGTVLDLPDIPEEET